MKFPLLPPEKKFLNAKNTGYYCDFPGKYERGNNIPPIARITFLSVSGIFLA